MQVPLPFYVYILFSQKDHLLYIGFTSNLERRLENHNSGLTRSTAPRRPLTLIFCEHYLFKKDALNRESYFKTSMGRKAIKLMLRESLERMGYEGKMLKIEYLEEEEEIENS